MRTIFFLCCLVFETSVVHAQNDVPQPPLKRNSSRLLRLPDVQNDLELTDAQISEIKAVEIQLHKELTTIQLEANQDQQQNTSSRDSLRERIDASYAKADRSLKEKVLLPFQAKRFLQIRWRIELSSGGVDRFFANESIATYLDLTEQEKKEFSKAALEERIRLAKEFAKLKRESEKRILTLMPKSAQAKLKKIIGDEFEIEPSNWQPRNNKGEIPDRKKQSSKGR